VDADPDQEPREPERIAVTWPGLGYWARVTVVVALVLGLMLELRKAADVLVLALAAAVLAVGLDPAVRFLERRGMRRGFAVMAIFVGSILVFAGFLTFAIPEFVGQIREFAKSIPSIVSDLSQRDDWIGEAMRNANVQQNLQDFVAQVPSKIASSFGSIVGVTTAITGLLFRLFTIAILTVYFMLTYPSMRRAVAVHTPVKDRTRLERVIDTSTRRIGGYVSGSFILAGLSSLAAAIVLIALGVQFWFPLAIWAGLASLIPIVGAYLGALPAVLIALAQSPGKAIAVTIFFVVWQQLRDYVIGPPVMKDSVNLSPAAVILATVIGGSVGGFFGILLALPIAATLKVVVLEYMFTTASGGSEAEGSDADTSDGSSGAEPIDPAETADSPS
jgi:predicted PurR-regulated permease PerM